MRRLVVERALFNSGAAPTYRLAACLDDGSKIHLLKGLPTRHQADFLERTLASTLGGDDVGDE